MKTAKAFATGLALIVICGCTVNGQNVNREEMLTKASALTKVARAVASAVEFKDAPANLSEAELLRFATQHDPEMLEPFRDYLLRARRAASATSVLMCTKDGRIALIEDSGCSARLDAQLWERSPPLPCAFQLNLGEVCPR